MVASSVIVGFASSIGLGNLAARHIMHVPSADALSAANIPMKADRTVRWSVQASPEVPPPFSIIPSPDHADLARQQLSIVEHTVLTGKGDTLIDLLVRGGASAPDAHNAADAIKGVFDPRNIKPGVPLTLTFGPSEPGQNHLMKVSLPTAVDQTVSVERGGGDEFNASKVVRPLTRDVVRGAGVIHSSLYEDGIAAGLPAPLLAELIHAFSYDVDFQRDIQTGDHFDVAYECFSDMAGRVVKTGSIIYASLTLSGRALKIYHFTPKSGFADYYNDKGESVRKALLRTPVDGARLTSRFGMRMHPVLGFSRMHKGVDFGAAAGTPIMAAGDGTVEIATFNYSYGNYLRIRHNGQYSTAYAHMSRIAQGMVKGAHVRQGQVIGYVGATGLATGPHLHYEVLVNNVQINPASIKVPTGTKLAGADLKSFEQVLLRTEQLLASLPTAARTAQTAF